MERRREVSQAIVEHEYGAPAVETVESRSDAARGEDRATADDARAHGTRARPGEDSLAHSTSVHAHCCRGPHPECKGRASRRARFRPSADRRQLERDHHHRALWCSGNFRGFEPAEMLERLVELLLHTEEHLRA
jgi:hypothetical protein